MTVKTEPELRHPPTKSEAGSAKPFRVLVALVSGMALVGLASLLTLYLSTQRECSKILGLEGRTGPWEELVAEIRPSVTVIDDSDQQREILAQLAMPQRDGVTLLRFNGEGLPYYWGWVAYDTNTSTVLKSEVELLW